MLSGRAVFSLCSVLIPSVHTRRTCRASDWLYVNTDVKPVTLVLLRRRCVSPDWGPDHPIFQDRRFAGLPMEDASASPAIRSLSKSKSKSSVSKVWRGKAGTIIGEPTVWLIRPAGDAGHVPCSLFSIRHVRVFDDNVAHGMDNLHMIDRSFGMQHGDHSSSDDSFGTS